MEQDLLPPEFLQSIRLSLGALQDDAPGFDPQSPALRKLVEQILFSRRFILTYYGVLGALIGVFSIHHWAKKLRSRQKKVDSKESRSDTPTSGTTLLPSETTSVKDLDTERTPLLYKDISILKVKDGRTSQLLRRLQAFLMWQPKPIPAITAPENSLPPNGTSLVILLFLAINVFYLFYHIPLTIPMLFAFADRAGLCFVINLPVLYVLAAKTNQPLQFLTGWSYEGLNLYHRRLGEWMTVFAVLHGAAMFGVWYTLLRPFHFGLLRFLSSRVILLGIFALIAYLTIYITSIGWIRRLYYEMFLGTHLVLQVTALILLYFHHHGSRPYVLASLLIWTLDRIVSRSFLSRQTLVAALQITPDQKTVLVFCEVPISVPHTRIRKNIFYGWLPGQHIFITVPGLGWQHQLQAHPFTIASPAPPAGMTRGVWQLQLTIRAQDGFSKDLLEYAKFHQHTEVSIDGPYGNVTALEAAKQADRVLFIAGGSGIAVTYPLCWGVLVDDQASSLASARSIYEDGARRGPDDLMYEELENTDRFAHLWVRQNTRADSWIAYFPRRQAIAGQTAANASDDRGRAEADSVVRLVTSKFQTGGVHALRPDIPMELHDWAARGKRQENIVVIVSGPSGLVRDVRNAAASLVLAGYNIDVHVEVFGW